MDLVGKKESNFLDNITPKKFKATSSTVSDWVPKKDSANFESDAFL